MRPKRAIEFSYKVDRGVASPIIPVEINGVILDAYVDSGAFFSVFSAEDAPIAGINFQLGKKSHIMVGDGSLIPVYFHILPIKIGPISFQANIGFSPKLGIGFNLIGRKDIFTRFIVIFNDTKRKITFIPQR